MRVLTGASRFSPPGVSNPGLINISPLKRAETALCYSACFSRLFWVSLGFEPRATPAATLP